MVKSELEIRINRSARRRKTVSARLVEDGRALEVSAPAAMSDAELEPIVAKLRDQLLRRKTKHETADDGALARRTDELNREYFGGKLQVREIRFVTNQQQRYGSCTPKTGVIRISHRLATVPAWVRDYVIIHELAHLLEANHSPRFWKLVARYPRTERARGYLMALGLESETPAPETEDVE